MNEIMKLLESAEAEQKQKELKKLTSLKEELLPKGCEAFEDKPLRREKLELIEQANVIVEVSAHLLSEAARSGWSANHLPIKASCLVRERWRANKFADALLIKNNERNVVRGDIGTLDEDR